MWMRGAFFLFFLLVVGQTRVLLSDGVLPASGGISTPVGVNSKQALDSPPPTGAPPVPSSTDTPDTGDSLQSRTNSLVFEDDIVEGVGKNPFDSLTRMGNNNNPRLNRLYRKKPHFWRETQYLIREMGLTQ